MNIILLGAPNSGKGTLSKDLCSAFKISQLSTGDMFRRLARDNNPEGIEARDKYWGKGNLVPDEQTLRLVQLMLSKEEYQNGVLFDGFPRTIPQAQKLESILLNYKVLGLETDREVIIQRAKNRRVCEPCQRVYGLTALRPKVEGYCDECSGVLTQRKDDLLIEERLEVYERQTKPLFEYYKDKIKIIDASKSPQRSFSQANYLLSPSLKNFAKFYVGRFFI